jgi:hypothetical protein
MRPVAVVSLTRAVPPRPVAVFSLTRAARPEPVAVFSLARAARPEPVAVISLGRAAPPRPLVPGQPAHLARAPHLPVPEGGLRGQNPPARGVN